MVYFLWLLLLLVSCQTDHSTVPHTTTFTDTVMTINYRIVIGMPLSQVQQQSIQQIISSTFSEIDAIYNKWNPNSELSKLNRLKAKQTVTLSPLLARFLQQVQQIVTISEGRFDPTIEPLQQLWKQKLQQGIEPTNEEIASITPAIGWDKVHFDDGIFYKDHDLTSLDLGGIAKGYCVDLLVERLNAAGYPNLFVDWGGEIRTSGKHPDNRPWHIFISRLGDTDPTHAIAQLDLIDQAIATSGDYIQNWTVAGNNPTTYFHIFDPKTARPIMMSDSSIASASVLAPTCLLADGLATAAMMFPSIAEATLWTEKVTSQMPDVQFWLLSRSQSSR